MIHICKKCGKQFEDERKQAAVCYECRTAVCVVCGERFVLTNKGQLTCSQKCSGIRKSRLGIAAKAASTKPTETKICKFCGKEFLPRTFRQVYCDGPHFKSCPVCGKPVEVKTPSDPAVSCSPECQKIMTQSTCLEKYGNVNVLNSDYGKEKFTQSCLERYGVEDYRSSEQFKQKYRATMQERYGVDYPLQSTDVKEKARQTNIERYGGPSPTCSPEVKKKALQSVTERYGGFGFASPELRARIESTNLVKYGSRCTLSSEEIRRKIQSVLEERYGTSVVAHIPGVAERRRATCIAKYGYPSYMQSPEGRSAVAQTMQSKYGVNNIMELPEYRAKAHERSQEAMIAKYGVKSPFDSLEIREKISQTFLEKYGVPWYTYMPECHNHLLVTVSSVNKAFMSALDQHGIKHDSEFGIQYDASDARHTYYYDVRLLDSDVLIELDPTYTHNSFGTHWGDGIAENYHMHKTTVALDHGYRCIHIFDWDSWDSIIRMLLPAQSIYARKCKLQRVSQEIADKFTAQNHLQGKCRGQVCNYGLFYQDELVQVMTFGKPRYNKKYDMELLRLCSKIGVRVVGGASRLFRAFVQNNPGVSVISYCNLAKFTGDVYEQIGMTLDNISAPAKVWSKGKEFITDNLLRQRGYDQIFGTSFGKGTSNEELMLENGWLPVYDCGQAVYTYRPLQSEQQRAGYEAAKRLAKKYPKAMKVLAE